MGDHEDVSEVLARIARVPEHELHFQARQALIEFAIRGLGVQAYPHRGDEGTNVEWRLYIEELGRVRGGHDGFVSADEFSANWQAYVDMCRTGAELPNF